MFSLAHSLSRGLSYLCLLIICVNDNSDNSIRQNGPNKFTVTSHCLQVLGWPWVLRKWNFPTPNLLGCKENLLKKEQHLISPTIARIRHGTQELRSSRVCFHPSIWHTTLQIYKRLQLPNELLFIQNRLLHFKITPKIFPINEFSSNCFALYPRLKNVQAARLMKKRV